eukprot:gene3804-4733_t
MIDVLAKVISESFPAHLKTPPFSDCEENNSLYKLANYCCSPNRYDLFKHVQNLKVKIEPDVLTNKTKVKNPARKMVLEKLDITDCNYSFQTEEGDRHPFPSRVLLDNIESVTTTLIYDGDCLTSFLQFTTPLFSLPLSNLNLSATDFSEPIELELIINLVRTHSKSLETLNISFVSKFLKSNDGINKKDLIANIKMYHQPPKFELLNKNYPLLEYINLQLGKVYRIKEFQEFIYNNETIGDFETPILATNEFSKALFSWKENRMVSLNIRIHPQKSTDIDTLSMGIYKQKQLDTLYLNFIDYPDLVVFNTTLSQVLNRIGDPLIHPHLVHLTIRHHEINNFESLSQLLERNKHLQILILNHEKDMYSKHQKLPSRQVKQISGLEALKESIIDESKRRKMYFRECVRLSIGGSDTVTDGLVQSVLVAGHCRIVNCSVTITTENHRFVIELLRSESINSSLKHLDISIKSIPNDILIFPMGSIPSGVEHLRIQGYSPLRNYPSFEGALEIGSIPDTVSTLVIDHPFIKHDPHRLVPGSVTDLTISVPYYRAGDLDFIPKSVKRLEFSFRDEWSCEDLLPGCIPEGITSLSFSYFFENDSKLHPGVIPNSVKVLKMIYNSSMPLDPGTFPESIQELTINCSSMRTDFQTNLLSGVVPKSILNLEFTGNLAGPVLSNSGIIPSTLTKLIVGEPFTENTQLPQMLEHLECKFNRIPVGFLPGHLKSIVFRGPIKEIQPNAIPPSVESISFIYVIEFPITQGILPPNLLNLTLSGVSSSTPFPVLPNSLVKLYFTKCNQPIPVGFFPPLLEHLELEGIDGNNGVIGKLPSTNLVSLHLTTIPLNSYDIPRSVKYLDYKTLYIPPDFGQQIYNLFLHSNSQLQIKLSNLLLQSLDKSDPFIYYVNDQASMEGFIHKQSIITKLNNLLQSSNKPLYNRYFKTPLKY